MFEKTLRALRSTDSLEKALKKKVGELRMTRDKFIIGSILMITKEYGLRSEK